METLRNLGAVSESVNLERERNTKLFASRLFLFWRARSFCHRNRYFVLAHRMSEVQTIHCIEHRKAVGYQDVEFQSLRRIFAAAEFRC
jgi:hypothetical protein